MDKILQKYKLTKEKNLKNDLILCKNSRGELFVLKKARGDECVMGVLVNELAKDYNNQFSLLQLPEYTIIDTDNGIVVMPFYGERGYFDSWNSDGLYGGAHMKLELAKEMAQIIYDFSKINLDKVVKHLNKHKVINFQFNFENWKKQFTDKAKILLQHGWISQEDSNKANELLKYGFKKSKLIFSNGDYYPKNLLNFKGKIVVIDWQTWNENYRVNIVDYIENVVAFTFIHMWNNRLWQIEFLKEVRKYFRIDFKDLRNAILIKSFEQAIFFKGSTKRKKQLLIFKNFLSDFYVKCLERNTRPSIRYRIFKKCHLR